MKRRFSSSFCSVESSVNTHLDRQERAECADCGQECSADRGFCSRACEEHYELGGMPGSLDARDATKVPPAYLDPLWVLLMRERLKRYVETGEVWFRPSGGPSDKREENANA